jgi:VWFA-related protein
MALGMMSVAVPAISFAQSTPETPTQPPAQVIPDAPGPKLALPSLPAAATAPGKATTPTYSGVPTPTDDQAAPGTSLPSSVAEKPLGDSDEQIEVPSSNGADIYKLAHVNVRFVNVPFTVKDSKGNLVPGLNWRDVRVYENNVRQHIAVFTDDPFPLSVALVIDQTLPRDAMTRVNNSLGALQGAFAPYDLVAVFTYTNQVKKQTDFTAGTSARLAAVVERSKVEGRDTMYYNAGEGLSRGIDINSGAQDHINPLTAPGPGSPMGLQQVQREGHPLNDAILAAAKTTTEAGPGRRRIVYVISDGKEYGSVAKEKDVIRYLQTNQIAVYATIVGDSSVSGMGFVDRIHIPLFMQDNVLPRYTAATGGQAYAEFRTPGIEKSFARITEQVRTQYTVGYYSPNRGIDNKFRSIDVRISRPNLNVIAKAGYYPQAAPVITRPARSTASTATKPSSTTP